MAEVVGGKLGLSDETTEVGYYACVQLDALDLMEHHRERLADAFSNQVATIVR